jgi:transcriptional regulator with XRE-family HTH domain
MENLKKIREKRKITQIKLSVDLGVSQETISGYEIGKSFPSAKILIQLADMLNTSTDYLLGRTSTDKPIKDYNFNELSDNEITLLYSYRKLSDKNKIKLLGYIEALRED